MKTLSPRLRRLTELPGPVWLFCALCLNNIYNWVLQLGTQFCDGRLHADSTGIIAAIWFSSLLHMIFCGVLIWGYVARKHFAVPLSAWYTGFILIQHFIGLLASFFNRDYFTYFSGPVFTQTFSSLFGACCVSPICAIWSVPKQWRVCIPARTERSVGGSWCCCSSPR